MGVIAVGVGGGDGVVGVAVGFVVGFVVFVVVVVVVVVVVAAAAVYTVVVFVLVVLDFVIGRGIRRWGPCAGEYLVLSSMMMMIM